MAQELQADLRAAGEEALARGDWAGARTSFEAVLAVAPGDAETLQKLAVALVLHGEIRAAREASQRAYVEYRRQRDARGAAAAAIFVAWAYRVLRENAAADGWLARAERCLSGLGLCHEVGAIEIERAKKATEPKEAEDHARRALEVGRELADPDLEIKALAQLGLALVRSGRWEEGMALLDEAMAAAMGGEATDTHAICDTCCQTLVACEQIADLRRASEWCRVVKDFSESRRFTPMHAWCRSIYAGVLIATGEWSSAERELVDSLRRYDSDSRAMGDRVMPLARLAELRLRQGRLEEAERLLEGHSDHPLALAPVARLRILRGNPAGAVAMVERRLDMLDPDNPEAGALLAILVEARLALADVGEAAAAAHRLEQLGERLRRDNLRALGLLASADVALARGDESARVALEAALDLFVQLGMPYEEAEARLRLAELFAGTGSALAADEARHALGTFEELGAAGQADIAAAFLRSLGMPGRTPSQGEPLTGREREVLALLGEGLTNAEIAGRLVISEKTAGHHVSRIYRKLGLRNRAEAAAYALRARSGATR